LCVFRVYSLVGGLGIWCFGCLGIVYCGLVSYIMIIYISLSLLKLYQPPPLPFVFLVLFFRVMPFILLSRASYRVLEPSRYLVNLLTLPPYIHNPRGR